MRKTLRLNEYMNDLQDKRDKEFKKKDIENEYSLRIGNGISSPTGNGPTEELKTMKEYIHSSNLVHLAQALPDQKKNLMLRKFFKHKRNQLVEVYSTVGDHIRYTRGKVRVVGRNFVILTNLTNRYWIPYSCIENANIPFGIPDVSNTHQHVVFDEGLRKKILTQFSTIVAKKDVLIQLLFEESLWTHLDKWRGVTVKIDSSNGEITGKIFKSTKGTLILKSRNQYQYISVDEIFLIQSIRFLPILRLGAYI